jgi:hypothetical protein
MNIITCPFVPFPLAIPGRGHTIRKLENKREGPSCKYPKFCYNG